MAGRKKQNSINLYKNFFQLGVFAFLLFMGLRIIVDKYYIPDFEAYCPFGGMQALSSFFQTRSLACTMTTTQIMMGLGLTAGIVLFGKLFCGYICPLGTVSEYLGKAADKLRIRRSLKGWKDLVFRSLKYILLFISFYFTLKSSELFCKKFDPYYAIASGFNTDVIFMLSIPAIVLLIAGSFFIRFSWCKYLCPLSAISNIFKFFLWFVGILGLCIILWFAGMKISYIWPLVMICLGGYVLEILRKRNVPLSPVRVTRNEESCTNCNLCSKKCPQGIDVAHSLSVTDIDCNLCGDCLFACPEKNTLGLNKRNLKHMPALVLTVLIIAGWSSGKLWQLPTISEKWGTIEELNRSASFSISGLKQIKCYGSSKAFSGRMKEIKGIFGVSTYVKTNSATILYDTTILNPDRIREIIFTPLKKEIRPLPDQSDSVAVYHTGIDNFFDPYDVFYLEQLLKQRTSSPGFYTEYGCPVLVHIFFPISDLPDINELINIIETKNLNYGLGDQYFHVRLKFKVVSKSDKPFIISKQKYIKDMYAPINMNFNNYELFSDSVLKAYKTILGENAEMKDEFDYLISHLSNDPGIIGFKTFLDEKDTETAEIIFVDTLTSADAVFSLLNADTLIFTYNTGETGTRPNPFKFTDQGVTMPYRNKNNN